MVLQSYYRVKLRPRKLTTESRKPQVRFISRLLQAIMHFVLIFLASIGMISQVVALPRAGTLIMRVQHRILLC